MRTDVTIHWLDAFIFLALFQAFFISFFIIRNGSRQHSSNIYQGLFLISFAFLALEEFLHNTGFISRALPLLGFSQPFNYTLGPFFFLYVVSGLFPSRRLAVWYHLILPVFWSFYYWFYLLQPDEVKYNSYLHLKHPDWPRIEAISNLPEDPLSIRKYANEITIASLLLYGIASLKVILNKLSELKEPFFKSSNEKIRGIRNSFIHFFLAIVVFGLMKISWGMTSDVGMVVITYFCFYIFLVSYQIMSSSRYFNETIAVLDFPAAKYKKSSLNQEQKEEILFKITKEMQNERYFTDNLSSLSGLADRINQSPHHVSQVINEQLGKTYFELLSSYRVEYAKKLLTENSRMTVEEVAEKVGYNSKSSFNATFKKLTSFTPSEFRNKK